MLVLYVFFQVSSYFFWVPSYKDGGNGSAFADWYVWTIWAVIMTALASIPMLVAKLVNRTN